MNYCLLINNKHYLTYNVNAEKIILAEFNILNEKYKFAENVQIKDICGLKYLSYKNINDNIDILDKISELSFVLGIFEQKKEFLKPITKTNIEFVNNNISSLLKYSGKTNEYFTKLMINIAANLIDKNENINLLDPICGKGTSLYEGLIKGYNCYGIEIASKVVEEIFIFLKKFLEKERYKFNSKKEKFSGENKSFKAEKFIFEINKNKENKVFKHFEVVSANTFFTDKIYKKSFFDIIVGDLPYGVKHSNISNEKQSSFTRNPKELLEKSLDSWKNVLNENGILVISWNTFLLKREDFKNLLTSKGFKVIENENLLSFEHRVDQAINRDIIVAKK